MSEIKNGERAVCENIALLSRRRKIVDEQAKISLACLCGMLCENITGEGIGDAYADFCRRVVSADTKTKTVFCKYVCERRQLAEYLFALFLHGNVEVTAAGTHGKIAYVRNKRTDVAYSKLSRGIRGSKAYHVSTFAEACEAVWENTSEFCILPIENSKDGKLYSFYAMLDRYELKICAVAEVADDDGAGNTAFALVGRSIEPQGQKNVTRRMEFSVICESADAIADISEACRALGGTLYAVGTQALPYDDRGNKYYFAADFTVVTPLSLALFASLEYPRFALVGLYKK